MSPSSARTSGRGPSRSQVRAVMDASRVLVALIAESVAEVDDHVTPTQMRILVLVDRLPGANLSAVAEALDVHPSNATRAVDRLVRAGFVARTESERDRRNLELSLTDEGSALLHRVMEHRRRAFERVLRQMEPGDRESLAGALDAFARAAGEPEDSRWAP
ncbi:MarR family winged helix-turn-helix transcriptional regulator [Angustibacter sp. Root456]|uniref:MarR family winged helix-turn-helix transcriptional regulator n=1 Tax=Angustibacter sp. Root456 TaxID=1736539 RepID=UPI00191006FC|nr:MarR family transcriptional regulator [Angustibacter sp. Root456]